LVFCTKKNLATLGQRSIAVICDGYVRFSWSTRREKTCCLITHSPSFSDEN
jgi:hypothetical protein